MTEAILEYMIRYIPVAELTFGGTPMPIKYGLKMTPPPKPRAPATKPPPNPRRETFLRIVPVKTRSLGTRLISLYFFFKSYSFATILTAKYRVITMATKNAVIVNQSPSEHFSRTIFLIIFMIIFTNKAIVFIIYFLI